jgi:hypothetical protein
MTGNEITFGTLVDVEARTAWGHEAHDFTPWLADNLERLSDAIGVKLEFTAREHLVGRFSADIIARSVLDDRIVLIENQLEWSDHKHLGQIMTYLAGTDAKIIVWIAPFFCDEHLSAIKWLNEHSHDEFAFFAVKLRIVRIGDSPLAPLFEVLEKPNNWERSLSAEVRSQGVSEATLVRRAFWELATELDPSIVNDRATGPGGSNRWRTIPNSHLVVNRYKSQGQVGLSYRTTADMTDEEFIEFMAPYADALAQELECEPTQWSTFWQIGPDLSDSDRTTWTPAAEWLTRQTARYVAAIQKIILKEPA